jgi:curved DNA-binding protein CbpA
MNPYEVLEVPREADRDTIRRNYRILAKMHHPDHGGEAATFREIQEAYEILTDPERRARFDQTGETDQPKVIPPDAVFLETVQPYLIGVILEICKNGMSPDHVDVLDGIIRAMRSRDRELEQQLGQMKKAKANLTAAAARFETKEEGGDNLLADLTRSQIAAVDNDLTNAIAARERITSAIKKLGKYRYRLPRNKPFVSTATTMPGGFWTQIQ